MKKHTLTLNNKHLHASFSKEYLPILKVDSGDSVEVLTPDIGWGYIAKKGQDRVTFQSRELEQSWGHPMIGPIYLNGAKPGMTIEIRMNEIKPGWYGWNCAGGKKNWQNDKVGIAEAPETTLQWELNDEIMIGKCQLKDRVFSVPLQPFMGILGLAPSEPGIHSTIPPRRVGGNIDCKELVKGSSLFLPVEVEGGLFSIGDGHAAQGDGEVSGQAIECPMEVADFTMILRENMEIALPRAKTPSAWITFGFHEDLNEATALALYEMVLLIQSIYKVSKTEATALASVAVDLRITQVVNGVKGVHAVLPHGTIR
ncbi:acetamidase/formamidase family protein [Bacillus salitolerans]|uniref:Acetamidase/formamidase family protein n=1 Tax=Bacillus salitolerans TaxID=1437434 RepID=A0ABW4LIU5_9BACI